MLQVNLSWLPWKVSSNSDWLLLKAVSRIGASSELELSWLPTKVSSNSDWLLLEAVSCVDVSFCIHIRCLGWSMQEANVDASRI